MRKIVPLVVLSFPLLASTVAAAVPAAAQWEIGPIIRGKNYSAGMPLRPEMTRTGWRFDFPQPRASMGHVHYVTYDPGSLAGKKQITIRYRIEAAPGVRFVAQEAPDRPATMSLYFQQRGDNWSAKRQFGSYRWYSPEARMLPLEPGEREVTIPLNGDWRAVGSFDASEAPEAFARALGNAGRVGVVFGSSAGRGHGVFATGPARFELLSFRVS